MGRTITKQIKKFLIILMCGAFLLVNGSVAFAATEAVYEDDVERWENNVYRGIVNTDDLNVRSAAGKNNPVVQVNGKGVTLNKQDEVAILDEALSSGEKWYKVSFRRDETLVVGYVHSYYIELTTDVLVAETVVSTTTDAGYEDVITPLPSSTSADSMIDSQPEESGSKIGFRLAVIVFDVVVVILILCIKKISNHSYSKGYSGTSYSSSSGSSNSGGNSSSSSDSGVFYNSNAYRQAFNEATALLSGSSYGYSEPFDATDYVQKHCSAYRSGMVFPEDQKIIKNDPSLTSEQKEEALRALEHLSHLWNWD